MKRLLAVWLAATTLGWTQGQPSKSTTRLDPVVLNARGALGDVIRYGRPCPIEVDIEVNDARVRHDARLQVGDQNNYVETQVHLQPGKQQVSLPIHQMYYGNELRLEGLPNAFKPQSSQTLTNMSQANDYDYLALILSSRPNQFAYLGGYKSLLGQQNAEFRLNQRRAGAALPDLWWSYLANDLVVVHDLPALKLNDKTETALLRWVRAGGSLVLVSNLDPNEYEGSALASLAPLQKASLDDARPPMLQGTVQGEVLLRSGNRPLLSRSHLGMGSIFEIAAPATDVDVLGTKKTEEVWQKIIQNDSGRSYRSSFFEQDNRQSTLPELPAPATTPLAWYLTGYVFLAVPAIYTYLRRKDRLLRLIVVVPACSLLFSAGAYVFNTAGRGREVVIRGLGLATLGSGQKELISDESQVVFSPRTLSFDENIDSQVLLDIRNRMQSHRNPGRSVNLVWRGDQLRLENERIAQWGISRWRTVSVKPIQGTLSVQVTSSRSKATAKINNTTSLHLDQAILCLDQSTASEPFPIKAGQQTYSFELKKATRLEDALKIGGPEVITDSDRADLVQHYQRAQQSKPALLVWASDLELGGLAFKNLGGKVIRNILIMVTTQS